MTPRGRRGRDRRLDVVAISEAMNALLGTKFKIVLAIRAATRSTSRWNAARSRAAARNLGVMEIDPAGLAHRKKINILVQIGLARRPTCRMCRC